MTMPVNVNSTANTDPNASASMWGTFTSSPSYNKPGFNLSNPLHIAVVLGAVVLGVMLWKKKR